MRRPCSAWYCCRNWRRARRRSGPVWCATRRFSIWRGTQRSTAVRSRGASSSARFHAPQERICSSRSSRCSSRRGPAAQSTGIATSCGVCATSPAPLTTLRPKRSSACSPGARGRQSCSCSRARRCDLVSEGLNLQDATRVVHYDLPWSPARLAQRVGRVDRLGSPHDRVEAVTFLPPPALERALAIEQRLAAKLVTQAASGAAQLESVAGPAAAPGRLDWCDRLQRLRSGVAAPSTGTVAAVAAQASAVVLIVRIGSLVEALVVTDHDVRPDPGEATRLLEEAACARPVAVDRARLERAVQQAAPLVRARLAALEDARWRASDRDRLSRRLIPWVLGAARRAARRGDARQLARLDALVSRLALGMTAGEELLLDELLSRRTPLTVRNVLAWHERLPPSHDTTAAPQAELVAAVLCVPG